MKSLELLLPVEDITLIQASTIENVYPEDLRSNTSNNTKNTGNTRSKECASDQRSNEHNNAQDIHYAEDDVVPNHTTLHVTVNNSSDINVSDFEPSKLTLSNSLINNAAEEYLSRRREAKLTSCVVGFMLNQMSSKAGMREHRDEAFATLFNKLLQLC